MKPRNPNGYNLTKRGNTWLVRLRDPQGSWKAISLFTDKRASESVAQRMADLMACKSAGESPTADLIAWARKAPPKVFAALKRLALVDVAIEGSRESLLDILNRWATDIAAESSSKQADQQRRRAEVVLHDTCLCSSVASIDLDDTRRGLEQLARERSWSPRTTRHHVAALRQFGAWLFNAGLVTPDPLSRLPLPKVTQEREPGVFTSEEIRLLVTSCQYGETLPTRASRAKWSMTGPDRAVFYLVAVTTGLRAGELRQLRRCDFDLEASVVTIPAHVAKSRKQQRVPLRADVTEQLAEYLSPRHPGGSGL